jgi:hypothetical protein
MKLTANIVSVDTVHQTATTKLEMTLIWSDPKHDDVNTGSDWDTKKLWVPVLHYNNAVDVHSIIEGLPVPFTSRYFAFDDEEHGSKRFYRKEVVAVTHRTSNKYLPFPFDEFDLGFEINMEAEMNGEQAYVDVVLINDAKDSVAGKDVEDRMILEHRYSPAQVTDGFHLYTRTFDDTSIGIVRVSFSGDRVFAPMIYQYWIPSFSFTLVSFITLWIPVKELMPRLGVSAVMLLTMANFLQQIVKNLPQLDDITLTELLIIVQICLICAISIFHVLVHRIDHVIDKERARLKKLHDLLIEDMKRFDRVKRDARNARDYVDRHATPGMTQAQRSAAVDDEIARTARFDPSTDRDSPETVMPEFSQRRSSALDLDRQHQLAPKLDKSTPHTKKEEDTALRIGQKRAEIKEMKTLTARMHYSLNMLNGYVRITAFVLWASLVGWVFCYAFGPTWLWITYIIIVALLFFISLVFIQISSCVFGRHLRCYRSNAHKKVRSHNVVPVGRRSTVVTLISQLGAGAATISGIGDPLGLYGLEPTPIISLDDGARIATQTVLREEAEAGVHSHPSPIPCEPPPGRLLRKSSDGTILESSDTTTSSSERGASIPRRAD